MMMDEERREARSWLVGCCSCAAAAVSIAAVDICVEALQFRVSVKKAKRDTEWYYGA
jgi:hypothetical protein